MADLAGTWQAAGQDVQPGTLRRVGREGEVVLACGTVHAEWEAAAEQGLLTMSSNAWSGACSARAPWLGDVASFVSEGDGHQLRDADGAEVAVLTPAPGEPVPTPAPPVVAAPLPAGLGAPGPQDLQGPRWVPVGAEGTDAHAVFGDGAWTGSDGCNGQGGGSRPAPSWGGCARRRRAPPPCRPPGVSRARRA